MNVVMSPTLPKDARRAAATLSDPRWGVVMKREGKADGAFYYSVATTGVFCRPSCGARRPRPENVRFHVTAADAVRAGFRPCKRCKPLDTSPAAGRAALIAKACHIITAAEGAVPSDLAVAEARPEILLLVVSQTVIRNDAGIGGQGLGLEVLGHNFADHGAINRVPVVDQIDLRRLGRRRERQQLYAQCAQHPARALQLGKPGVFPFDGN